MWFIDLKTAVKSIFVKENTDLIHTPEKRNAYHREIVIISKSIKHRSTMTSSHPPSSSQSLEALQLEVASLRKHLRFLNRYKVAMEAQEKLFRSVLTMSNVSSGKLMLRSVLMEITEVTRGLVRAKDASLFMLDDKGVITESILARGPTVKEEKEYLNLYTGVCSKSFRWANETDDQ